jgi:hypothetical protein
MAFDKNKAIERSVDSIARIYAIIIGLSLAEAVKTLIVKDGAGQMDLSFQTLWSGSAPFFGFVVTLVPFWHGMNRHLDRSYLEKEDVSEGALLLDFGAFFIESSLFLVAAWGLRTGLVTYYCLLAVFALDVIWGGVSHLIHSRGGTSHSIGWSTINIIFGVLMVGVITFPFEPKPPVLTLLAAIRTIIDYWRGRKFYFPNQTAEMEIKEATEGKSPLGLPKPGQER